MTDIILKDITQVKTLPLNYAYLPNIRGTQKQCIDQLKAQYPWLDCEGWYHVPTQTAFIPCDWVRKP